MNKILIKKAIEKGKIDEGMEQILHLLMNYNVNDESYINDAITHLAYHSMAEEEE